jgi:hypothetical protein
MDDVCRICWENKDENDCNILYSPCFCKGTQKYIHKTCFNLLFENNGKLYCQTCNYKYKEKFRSNIIIFFLINIIINIMMYFFIENIFHFLIILIINLFLYIRYYFSNLSHEKAYHVINNIAMNLTFRGRRRRDYRMQFLTFFFIKNIIFIIFLFVVYIFFIIYFESIYIDIENHNQISINLQITE